MSDISLNKFIQYGTAAQRAAFTPSPAAGTQPIYVWYETDTGATYIYDTAWHQVSGSSSSTVFASACEHRLTLETGVPVSTTDQTGKSNVYFTPYVGNQVALYSGTAWAYYTVPEIAIVLSGLTSGKNYDVFAFASTATPSSTDTATDIVTFGSATGWATGSRVIPASTVGGLTINTTYYYNAASSTTGSFHTTLANAIAGSSKVDLTANITQALTAVSLELSAAWTNDTTRADALTTQDSIAVKSGATTRRHVGLIRTTNTTTTEDSAAKRFVWSVGNRVPRDMVSAAETMDSWNYTTATWREANANTANRLQYVAGLNDIMVEVDVKGLNSNSSVTNVAVGVGVDVTNANSAQRSGSNAINGITEVTAFYKGYPGIGYHFLSWLEISNTVGTTVWYGDAGFAYFQAGPIGTVWN